MEIVKDIKEKVCFVAQDFEVERAEADTSSAKDMQFTLPDKRVITISGANRMVCPELLFKPELNGMTCKGIHQLCNASIQASDIDVRKDLCKNIIMSGGTTMYEGIADRLKSEVTN